MPTSDLTLDEARRIRDLFLAAGAQQVRADILQPAEILLDLYGEDIRARAFVIHDPLRGEMMLRPDFTVPVVQMHMAHGAEPARYAYSGKVFRRQEEDTGRPGEYVQVGYEVFARDDPAAADAEVFALISSALSRVPTRAVIGDIGIVTAAVRGLNTTERRKRALMRHIWRPGRFRSLLDRFGGRSAMPAARAALLADPDPMATGAPLIGLRSRSEIAERIEALRADAAAAPIDAGELSLLEALLAVRDKAPDAAAALRRLAGDLPSIAAAVDRLCARLDALEARGIDTAGLDFETTYGRASMEYYDGFVFGIYATARDDLPPLASGGRYDALTARLGRDRSIPAVGGVLRPALIAGLAKAET